MTALRILIAVITGGRPLLSDRTTRKFFDSLRTVGDIEYVVREDHAAVYEDDPGVPLNVYPVAWANRYAVTHWRHPRAVFEPGGFHGAFTGREWAMRSGESRGYDLVLQLDDNIEKVGPINSSRTGGMGYRDIVTAADMVRIAAEIAQATNLSMLGFQLSAVAPQKSLAVARVGYPYSFFLEKTGPGRMPYYGPFEDDIMHALEYALHGGPGRTAGLLPAFVYEKEGASKTGMRKHYNAERGLELALRYPRNTRLVESRRTASPRSLDRGIRHMLNTKGFTPIRVTDRERYAAAQDELVTVVRSCQDRIEANARAKIARRMEKKP